MATLVTGGGRRSAAPVYNTTPQAGTNVLNSEATLQQLLTALNAPQAPAIEAESTAFEPEELVSMPGAEAEWARDASLGFRGVGLGLQGYGQLTGNAELEGLGSELSGFGGYANSLYGLANAKNATDVAKAGAPAALKALEVPAPYAGMVLGAINDGPRGAVSGTATAALSVAFPMLGIANALSGVFGGPTIGSLLTDFIGGDKPPATPEQEAEAILAWLGGVETQGETEEVVEDIYAPDYNPNVV